MTDFPDDPRKATWRDPKKHLYWGGASYSGTVSREMVENWTFTVPAKPPLDVLEGKEHDLVVSAVSDTFGECLWDMGEAEITHTGEKVQFRLKFSDEHYPEEQPMWTFTIPAIVKDWIEMYCGEEFIDGKWKYTTPPQEQMDAIRAQLTKALELLDGAAEGAEVPK